MSQQDNAGAGLPKTWSDLFQTIVEGGIPQIIAGPAGNAISRLIGGIADIPAAWLNQQAQSIRDETEARSSVMKTLAEKSAELGVSDTRLLERGLNNMLGRSYREQRNKDDIAGKVIEQLRLDPPPLDGPGPSDDWLNVFEGHAANASSEWVRENWARVLAGEIRKPASFSLQTLALLSQLDQSAAVAVEATLSRVMRGQVVILESVGGEEYQQLVLARSLGIIHQLDPDSKTSLTLNHSGKALIEHNGIGIVVNGHPTTEFSFPCNVLSRVGRELYSVLRPASNEAAVSKLIDLIKRSSNVTSIDRGDLHVIGGVNRALNTVRIWDRATG